MLSSSNIEKINRQIREEMRTVSSFTKSDEEKDAALSRIAKLKELLEPTPAEQPSRKTLLRELATALIEAREETRERNRPVDLFEAIFGIRNR